MNPFITQDIRYHIFENYGNLFKSDELVSIKEISKEVTILKRFLTRGCGKTQMQIHIIEKLMNH